MSNELPFDHQNTEVQAISPYRELGAYEALWDRPRMSFKRMAELHRTQPGSRPSHFVEKEQAYEYADRVQCLLDQAGVTDFGIRVQGGGEYPANLKDAVHPLPFFYYQGWWDLIASSMVAVVGTRKPTREGEARTRRLVKALVADDYTIVSGLAAGIDTVAHTTAIEQRGRTAGVIGTPLSETYPKSNTDLQAQIAKDFLLISQIPVWLYSQRDYRWNRRFFPERNVTMSALTRATIIVEAGQTSGTLIQASAALQQGRKLFILDNCFRNPKLSWPRKFAQKGAIRVFEYDDIRCHLESADPN